VHVLQGERAMAGDNKSLGRFKLDGIPPMPAGMPQVEITYDIDANGVLNVSAKEKSTGKAASITIQNTTTLGDDEVERMVQDAAKHGEEDRVRKEKAEAMNQLDGLRLQAQKVLDDAEGATDEQKKPVQDAIAEAQGAIDGKAAKAELDAAGQKLATTLQAFQQATAASSAGSEPEGGEAGATAPEDDVIDADFKPAS
jgi:molecular chaperone DnaK